MGAELARKRKGQSTETGMSEKRLREFASKPLRKKKKHKSMGVHPDKFGYY